MIKIPGIVAHIRRVLQKYPYSTPKEIARLLWNKVGKQHFEKERDFYLRYRNLINTEKWAWNKWLKTEKKGRLPKSLPRLMSGHRIEWTFEAPLSQVVLQKINEVSRNLRPKLRDPKPVDYWYMIPNRNRMREFHNNHITVRVFPKSGTVRILPSRPMSWEEIVIHLERALYLGGLEVDEAEALARRIVPHKRHRSFLIGRIDPFRVDYYRRSLGLTLFADGTHPKHLEVDESFPAWIPPLLQSNNRIAEAVTEFAKQIQAHLEVLQEMKESAENLTEAVKILKDLLERNSERI